jgi:hypothetical protein
MKSPVREKPRPPYEKPADPLKDQSIQSNMKNRPRNPFENPDHPESTRPSN